MFMSNMLLVAAIGLGQFSPEATQLDYLETLKTNEFRHNGIRYDMEGYKDYFKEDHMQDGTMTISHYAGCSGQMFKPLDDQTKTDVEFVIVKVGYRIWFLNRAEADMLKLQETVTIAGWQKTREVWQYKMPKLMMIPIITMIILWVMRSIPHETRPEFLDPWAGIRLAFGMLGLCYLWVVLLRAFVRNPWPWDIIVPDVMICVVCAAWAYAIRSYYLLHHKKPAGKLTLSSSGCIT